MMSFVKMKKTALVFLGLILAFNACAADIILSWVQPSEREDGSQIEKIDRFNLYYSIDNVLQDVIEISGDATSFQLSEVKAGNHTFQISTVENDLEGKLSLPASVFVPEKLQARPVKIELTVRVVE